MNMPLLSKVTVDSEQAMSIKYNTMVYELKRKGENVIIMSLGEAFFDIPLFPMDTLPMPDLYHYSNSMGLPELREKLSKYFKELFLFDVCPEKEILVTAGSKAAIHMTLMSLINPEEEVLLPEPTWVSYPEQVKLCYGKPVYIPIGTEIEEYQKFVSEKTKAIIICNPNNPIGNVYSEGELSKLLSFAQKNNIWILSDEAYSEFVNNSSFTSLGRLDPLKSNSIIFNSISKNYGISGWRLGYVVANKDVIYNVLKVNQHLITCPATILEYYIVKYFDEILEITRPQIKDVVNKRNELGEYMKKIGLESLEGDATFYFFVSISPSKLSSEEFCTRLLNEYQVSVVPGIGYGESCDKFIRVSIGTASMEENKVGLRLIKELIEKTHH